MLAALAVVATLSYFDARDDATTAAPSVPGEAVAAQPGPLGAYLRAGNVELRYGDATGGATARRIARALAGAPGGGLAAAGQEVRAVRETGLSGLRALAWRRELRVSDPRDPALPAFVEHWLGRAVQG